jgi:hypothetical protein
MEYMTSVQIQIPAFVSCNNCHLWFPVEYVHYCANNTNVTHDYNICHDIY